jgi:hypothetical protein
VDGGEAVTLCLGYCLLHWDVANKFMYAHFPQMSEKSYALPVLHDSGLPKVLPAGLTRVEDFTKLKDAVILPQFVESAVSPSVYVYSRQNIRRNLYRIPLQ